MIYLANSVGIKLGLKELWAVCWKVVCVHVFLSGSLISSLENQKNVNNTNDEKMCSYHYFTVMYKKCNTYRMHLLGVTHGQNHVHLVCQAGKNQTARVNSVILFIQSSFSHFSFLHVNWTNRNPSRSLVDVVVLWLVGILLKSDEH